MSRQVPQRPIVWVVPIAVVALVGCASIVKKPEVNEVRSAAIVSLYANQKVPKKDGSGIVKRWDQQIRLQVAEDALVTFTQEMKRIGWRMEPPNKVVQSREYQEAFKSKEIDENSTMGKVIGFMQQAYRRQFFTPAGMMPIVLTDGQVNTRYLGDAQKDDPKVILANMARKLNVDAVVVVQIDYCYQGGTFSLLGTGEAVMTAASSVKAVNRAGEVVINMPEIQVCGGKNRAKSDSAAPMLKGDLLFTSLAKGNYRDMFIEATRKSAQTTIASIAKAMQ